ncbi:MAG: sensor histidine kinase [Fluviicola sp.]|jgi:two-component system sensor histidine kinase/response regulator
MAYIPKILIIDDNIENLKVVGNILQEENYDIAVSLNGQSAINILLNNQIDLILMDIMMPEMDGFETCRRIKEIDKLKEIPLIFLTAKSQTRDILEAFNVGGVDYIFKPFNRMELIARVKTHLDLFLSKRKLDELYKNRDLIYSILAHDIRTPFNKMFQFLQLLSDGFIQPNSPDFHELLSLLIEEKQRTRELIDELVEWGKIQMNEQMTELRPVNLRPIADSVIVFLEPQIQEKSLTIQNTISENLNVLGNEKSLEVVFRNLLANAIKFTPNGGEIKFSSEDKGNKASVILKDKGIGMTPDVLDKLFVKNEFYKTTGTNNEKGSGFGIHLIKDLVKKNNAKLDVKSQIDQGTTFKITLDKVV